MPFSATTATRKVIKLLETKKKILAVQGGTSASKTISILLVLIHLAQSDEKATLTSVVSESVPHLKRGAMRDFENILKDQGYWKDECWDKTYSTYTFETGSKIEFFSADSGDKLRGARRDRLFLNEANNIPFSAFEELEVRTKEVCFLDWNPTNEFWFYTDVQGHRTDVEHAILTYKDNEALSKEIIDSIEQRKNRKGWWQVYGLGLLGEVEGRIYKGWTIIDEVPEEARLERRGLDFGYTNDPTAIVDIYSVNGGFVLDEILYQKGLSNKRIADFLENQEKVLTIADSSEPKSIDELCSYGHQVIGAVKGRDSVSQGIQFVQDMKIWVTKRSINLIKEYRNYLWAVDKNGKILNVPEGGLDHCMDALRYGITSIAPKQIHKRPYKSVLERMLNSTDYEHSTRQTSYR